MAIRWLEQTQDHVPAGDHWLGSRERRRLAALHIPKRRGDWRLGRWTAKRAVAACLPEMCVFPDIEIAAATSGAPLVLLGGRPAAFSISISHSSSTACCAVVSYPAPLGCDLEVVETRSPAFVSDYFTASEQSRVAHAAPFDQPLLVSLIWSAKESALKALGLGLRAPMLSVSAEIPHFDFASCGSWQPLSVSSCSGEFRGWWRMNAHLVRTVVTDPPQDMPEEIELGAAGAFPA